MTVQLTLNPTIVRTSQPRIIDLGRAVRHNRRPGVTGQRTRNPIIARTSRLRIVDPRQNSPSRTDQNPIDLKLGLKRPSLHDRQLAMTVRLTQNLTTVRTSQPGAIGQRRTGLRIAPMRSPLELRNAHNRSHKHPKRKSARTSSARRSHSLPNKRPARPLTRSKQNRGRTRRLGGKSNHNAGLAPLMNLQLRAIETPDLERRLVKVEKLLPKTTCRRGVQKRWAHFSDQMPDSHEGT